MERLGFRESEYSRKSGSLRSKFGEIREIREIWDLEEIWIPTPNNSGSGRFNLESFPKYLPTQYSLDPIKSTMILPERFQKKHGKMIMENMILPVQIFLASRDLQYDFPKIGSLRSPVCNFLFTFVQVWLPNLRSQHFVPNLFSQKTELTDSCSSSSWTRRCLDWHSYRVNRGSWSAW